MIRLRVLALLLLALASGACLERGSDKDKAKPEPTAQAPNVVAVPIAERLRKVEPKGRADESATITLRLAGEPLHLNPLLAGDALAVQVTLGDVYEGLLSIDKPGQAARPALAQSFVRDTEGREWTFYLRKGVRFHSGAALRPADVVRSFELARKTPGPLQTDLDDLQVVRAAGADSVVFRFLESRSSRSEVFAAVPILSAKSFAGVSAKALQTAKASRQPNGTGPLRFTSWESGVIELSRFNGYWGIAARAQTIRYRVIPERTRVLAELASGGIDVAMRLPAEEALRGLAESKRLALVEESLPAYTAAVFNTTRAHLGIDTRRALSQSFDRKSIVRELFRGFGAPAIGPYTAESESNDPRLTPPAFSLDSARKEVARQWPDPKRSLTLLVPAGSRSMERLADIWAEDLRGVVAVEVEAVPFTDMLSRVRQGNFDVCFLSFTTSAQVDLYSLFHSSQVGSGNVSRLADPAMDVLLEGLRGAHSAEERRDRGRELHRLLVTLAPFAFLTSDVRLGLVNADVAGIGDSAAQGGARNLWRK